MNVKKRFGHAVRRQREKIGISQEELATRADLHRTYIGAVERGERNISLENIKKITEALGFSISELFVDME